MSDISFQTLNARHNFGHLSRPVRMYPLLNFAIEAQQYIQNINWIFLLIQCYMP